MAALRCVVSRIRIPAAAPLRTSRAFDSSSFPKSDLERALRLKNNIECAKEADVRSDADLLAEHANQAVEAMSKVVDKQEVVGGEFCTLAYKYFGSAVVLGCINRMLDHYWKDQPDPDLEFLAALEDPE